MEGNKINYNISEAEIEGYESKISGSQEEGFIVINREIKNINEVGKSKSDIEAKKSYEDIKSNDIKLQTIEDFKLPKTGINEFLERILYIIGLLLLFTGLFFNKISKNKY